ncbi:MAG: type III-B CRISPR module-associated protein Cmr5 [Thermocladium sp.]
MIEVQKPNGSLNLAIKCIDALKQVFSNNGDVMKGFRSRARDVPSSLYYDGILYTIAYVASKASKNNKSGNELLMQAFMESDVAALFREWNKKEYVEKEAYELYGACLMRALKELAELDNAKDLTDILKILNDSGTRVIIEGKVLEFTEWLKRLTEAIVQG